MSAKIPMFCAICVVPIPRKWSGGGNGRPKTLNLTCGRKCGAELQRRNGGYSKPRKPKVYKLRLCDCGRSKTSSDKCYRCLYDDTYNRIKLRTTICAVCGETISVAVLFGRPRKNCDDCNNDLQKQANRNAKFNRRSRKRNNGRYETIDRQTVFVSNDFTCMICLQPLNMTVCFPDPMSPSVDHIIPLARGGTHTYDNVQSAHLICNAIKSDHLDFANIV